MGEEEENERGKIPDVLHASNHSQPCCTPSGGFTQYTAQDGCAMSSVACAARTVFSDNTLCTYTLRVFQNSFLFCLLFLFISQTPIL